MCVDRRARECRPRVDHTRPQGHVAEKVRLSIRQAPVGVAVPEVQRLAALQADDARCLPAACNRLDDAGHPRAVSLAATEWQGLNDARRVVEPLVETRRSLVVVRIVEILRIGRAAVCSLQHLSHVVDRLRIGERVQQASGPRRDVRTGPAASCSSENPVGTTAVMFPKP